MNYNFRRALGFSLFLYVATFVVGLLAGLVSGQDMASMSTISDSFWYVGMVAAVILTAFFANRYLKSSNLVSSAMSGFWFGLTAVIISSLLDLILFSFGNSAGEMVDMGSYFGDFRYWVIVILVLGTAKITGQVRAMRKR